MHFRLLVLLVFIGLLPCLASARVPEVLLLHSEPAPTAWTRNIAAGLAAGFDDADIRQIFLETGGTDEDAVDAVFERLSTDLAGTAPLAVVTSGETAFAFARKYGENLFPDAPVVFCSMPSPDPDILARCANCTGLPLKFDLKASVDLLFSMRPQTRLVVVIADNTPATAPLMTAVGRAMQPYMDRAQVMFPGFEPGNDAGLDLKGLGETLASVPSSGTVLFLGFGEDRNGNPVSDEQIAETIRKHCASPIYVLRDAWNGSGVVGGWVVSGNDVGRDAARLVQRIRNGEPVQEMLPLPTRPKLRFDGTALTRFGLKPPPDAEVTNPPTPSAAEESALPVTGLAWALGLTFFAALLYGLRRYRA